MPTTQRTVRSCVSQRRSASGRQFHRSTSAPMRESALPIISIVTAVTESSVDYLAQTIDGVLSQSPPPGWRIEWIVQEDGTSGLAEHFADVECVRYEANGAQLGIAATRNLALSRVSGHLVQVLDSDDVLLSNAFSTMIPRFVEYPVHWAIGQADDLLPDGERVAWESALPFGVLKAGVVNSWAIDHDANWPIHCAGLMIRTASLRALGGWVGIPSDEDIAMFAALSDLTDGYNEPAVTWLYRQHPKQITRTSAWRSRSAAGRKIGLQRARAVRRAGLTFGGAWPLDFAHPAEPDLDVGPPAKERPKV